MNITDLIAVLAFIVALYSAILSTCIAINEFFRLKLSIIDVEKTCITLTNTDVYYGEYGQQLNAYSKDLYTVIIPVRIINKSKNSTTINEVTLNNTYKLNSSSSFDDFIPAKFNCKGNEMIAHASQRFDYPILKPLCKLKSLDTFECYLIFNNLKELPNHFNIKINTVQKSKTFHLHFKIANDYRNEIQQE